MRKRVQIVAFETGDRIEDAGVLRGDVAAAAIDGFGEVAAVKFEFGEGYVAKGGDFILRQQRLEAANALFAFGAASVVATGGDFVFNHAVADDEGDIRRKLNRTRLERAAIEKEC